MPSIKVEPSNYLVLFFSNFKWNQSLNFLKLQDVNIGEVDNDEIESIGDFVSGSEEAESCDDGQSDDDESHLFNENGSYTLVS